MAVHDNLPRGIQDHVDHSVRSLERFAHPVNDTLETLRQLAPALLIGMDSDVRALDEAIAKIKSRWAYFKANGAWASTEEVDNYMDRLPRASAKPEILQAEDKTTVGK